MVGDMLGKYNECNGDIRDCDGSDQRAVDILQTLDRFNEGEVRDGEDLYILECLEVDDLKCHVIGSVTDHGEDRCDDVADHDAEDEGNEFHHLLAVNRECEDCKEGHETADECYIGAASRNEGYARFDKAVLDNEFGLLHQDLTDGQVVDGVDGKRKSDQRNGRTDDDRRHEFVDPLNADEFNDERNDNVNESCKDGTDDETRIAGRSRSRAAECCEHRADKSKGRTEKSGAAELGEELVHQSTDACAKECGRLAHPISDDGGNENRCSKDRKHLLQCEQEHLREFWFVMNIINKIFSQSSIPPNHFLYKRPKGIQNGVLVFYRILVFSNFIVAQAREFVNE